MSEHLNKGHDFANVPKFCWIFGGGGVGRDDYCRFTCLCEVKRQTIPRNNQDRLRSSLSSLSSLEAVGFPPFSFQHPLAFFPRSSARREGWGRLLVLCPSAAPFPYRRFPDICTICMETLALEQTPADLNDYPSLQLNSVTCNHHFSILLTKITLL